MALIDQRILINAPTDAVWSVLGDPARLTAWHAEYTGISILTTRPTGVGARWRCTLRSGKDIVEQITAWVDGLGYEYTIVEGPFREFQGRLRLQAGPDGTSVQWTISYKPKGLFGLIRNLVSERKERAALMATSLRQLRREVDSLGVHMDDAVRARASIQGRLNADERAQYQRRYAPPEHVQAIIGGTALDQQLSPESQDAAGEQPAVEAVPAVPALPPADIIPPAPAPSFVAELADELDDEPREHLADTRPTPPVGLREAIADQPAPPIEPPPDEPAVSPAPPVPAEEAQFARPQPPEPVPPVEPPPVIEPPAEVVAEAEPEPEPPPHARTTPPHGIPSVRPTAPPPSIEAPKPLSQRPTPARGIPSVQPRSRAEEPPRSPNLPPPTPQADTGEMSIWEAFGLRRPSEQDAEALDDLVRSVLEREDEPGEPKVRAAGRRKARVRVVSTVLGLRLWLALKGARVRLHRARLAERGREPTK
ncbi:MAG: SRPBCC family protein [Chloroflexi bacterium]|nr:SRPBCC family protein [Chloroflexota bacterium]